MKFKNTYSIHSNQNGLREFTSKNVFCIIKANNSFNKKTKNTEYLIEIYRIETVSYTTRKL